MSGNNFLFDTNAIIYLLQGNSCVEKFLDSKISFSVISYMEMLSFPALSDDETAIIKAFLNDCFEVSISDEVKEKAIFLRKTYKIKLPDAIVAASAIENNLKLVTADRGFEKIKELNLILLNP